jgi:hypothetical protein
MDFLRFLKNKELERLFSVRNLVVARYARWYYRKLMRYHTLEELRELGFDSKDVESFSLVLESWRESYKTGVLDFEKVYQNYRNQVLRVLVKHVDLSHISKLVICGNGFNDLNLLKEFRNLRQLMFNWVMSNEDWSWLKEMKSLKSLSFYYCNIKDLRVLHELKQVLKGCHIIARDFYGKDMYLKSII